MSLNSGLPIEVFAVRADGTIRRYVSMTEAGKRERYSLQYVFKDVRSNLMRRYQSKDPRKRGTRFTTEQALARVLSDRLKAYNESYQKENRLWTIER